MHEILIYNLLTIIPLALLFGTFGTVALWEKGSFFGHIFAHNLLLPLSIGMALSITQSYYLILFNGIFAVLFVLIYIYMINNMPFYNSDTLLIIVSFICLSLSLFINNLFNTNVNLMLYIVGDILLVDKFDIGILYILAIIVLLYLIKFWHIIVLKVFSVELAVSHHKKANLISAVFLMLQAIFIALGIRVVGSLLMSAAMLLPAIISRLVSNSPKRMMVCSMIIGFIVMNIGSLLSLIFDIQFAPITIMCYSIILIAIYFSKKLIMKLP